MSDHFKPAIDPTPYEVGFIETFATGHGYGGPADGEQAMVLVAMEFRLDGGNVTYVTDLERAQDLGESLLRCVAHARANQQ